MGDISWYGGFISASSIRVIPALHTSAYLGEGGGGMRREEDGGRGGGREEKGWKRRRDEREKGELGMEKGREEMNH